MSGGLLDHLTQAHHIQAFVGCSYGTALEIVKAAQEYDEAKQAQSNVIRVDFLKQKPKDVTRGL